MKKFNFLIMAVAIGFASCRKTVDYSRLSSDFIVVTNLDKSTAFNSYKTYFLSDTVINLGGSGADTVLVGTDAQQLVNSVKAAMGSRGYNFVSRSAKPDLGLKLGVVKVVNVAVNPGWYDRYPGWFPSYWGGLYPYYYPWTTVYSYDTGTIILDMYDVKNAKAAGQYKAIWNATSFGALGSDAGANLNRGLTAINQSFQQSPYVNAN